VARAFERALRRAHVPMAFSQGFNPHPKVSWIGAAPTGVASEAEYVEIQLVSAVDPTELLGQLDTAMPDGLDLLDVVVAEHGALADQMEASRWRIELLGVSVPTLRDAVDELLAAERVEVERLTKHGMRTLDARSAIVSATVESPADHSDGSPAGSACGILVVVVRLTTPAVRPDDVLSALRVVAALEPPVPAKATRMAQGRLDDSGGLADPLAQDRVGHPG